MEDEDDAEPCDPPGLFAHVINCVKKMHLFSIFSTLAMMKRAFYGMRCPTGVGVRVAISHTVRKQKANDETIRELVSGTQAKQINADTDALMKLSFELNSFVTKPPQ